MTEVDGLFQTCSGGTPSAPYPAYFYDDGFGPSLIPRVWKVNAGETLNVTLTNSLAQPPGATTLVRARLAAHGVNVPPAEPVVPFTNLHFHGFNVSPGVVPPTPDGPYGDNVFVDLQPTKSAAYSVPLPANHPEGAHWFHPHPHGFTESEVLGGLSGLAVVGDLLADVYPKWSSGVNGGVKELFFLLKDFDVSLKGGPPPVGPLSGQTLIKTINGVTSGNISLDQNEVELWDFANIGAQSYFDLQLFDTTTTPNAVVPFKIVAIDGNPTPKVLTRNDLFLPPGARLQVLVEFPHETVTANSPYQLSHMTYSTGPWGNAYPSILMANVVVRASTRSSVKLPSAPERFKYRRMSLAELRKRAAGHARKIDFEEDLPSAKTANFYICGQTFNGMIPPPTQIVSPKRHPAVEEWTVTNNTQETHVFHIHQTDFVVETINGVPTPTFKEGLAVYQDTINVPPMSPEGRPGSVKLLIPFEIQGTFVYHCHILGHEDGGMMASICVKETDAQCQAPMPAMSGMAMTTASIAIPADRCTPKFPRPKDN